MTQKQKIIAAIAELENKLEDFYNSNSISENRIPRLTKYNRDQYSIEQYVVSGGARNISATNTVYDLERSYKQLQYSIENVLKEWSHKMFEGTDWYNTMKDQAETTAEDCRKKYININQAYFNKVVEMLKEKLGDRCSIAVMSDYNIEVGIYEKTLSRDKDKVYRDYLKFGHSFTVYNRNDYWGKNEKELEINYGCMGNFNAVTDPDRVLFLQMLAKFASDFELQSGIYNAMNDYKDAIEANAKVAENAKTRFEDMLNKMLVRTNEYETLTTNMSWKYNVK